MAPELIPLVETKILELGSDIAICATRCAWAFEDVVDDEGQIKTVARIKLAPEGAFNLYKAIKGRFQYKRHFTIKSDETAAITFFPQGAVHRFHKL